MTNYIASSHASGCVTITFVSDSSVQQGGWAATISCTTTAGGDPITGGSTPPANSVCSGSDPFCADAGPLEFPNVSDADCVPDAPAVIVAQTCLFSAPNPAWYYLEIDQAGPLNLQISQTTGPGGTGSTLDVDYALWGPFSSASAACADFTLGDCTADHTCTGTVVDCSYSISATETATIPNAQVGEVYMVLITNFNGAAGYITMTQTNAGAGGAGSTDCTIVCPVATGTNPSCGASDGIITIEGLDPSTSYNVTYLDDGTPVSVTLTSNASGDIIITGLNAGNYTNIVTNFPGCTTATSNVTLTSSGTPATLTSITNNSPLCGPANATYNLTGTPNATVTYNINGGASQTVTLNGSGIATVTVTGVTTNTTLNATSITSTGSPITGNGLSAAGGNTPVNSTGAISALGAAANGTNCAFVDNTNSTLTITLQHTVPIGTSIIVSLARDNNAGAVTVAGGGASTTFNAGPNDILQRITIVTTVATNIVTVTRTAGIVWVDGVQYTYTPPGCTVAISNSSTVTVNAQPNAGVDGNTTICDSSVTPINLFSLITGEQAGGTWTQTSGTGGTFNAGAGTFTPAVGATTSTFTYTLVGIAPCVNDTSIATININSQLAPTINCGTSTTSSVQFTWSAVIGATGYDVSYQINAGPIVNIGAIGNVLSYTVSGLVPGDNVLITLTPTGGAGTCFTFSTQTCTANNCIPPTATISYATPFCSTTATAQLVTLTGTGTYTVGSYSAPLGLSINAVTGDITPSTSTPGTYLVTYTIPAASGCSAVIATTSVTINTTPVADAPANVTACDSYVLPALTVGNYYTGSGGTGTMLPVGSSITSTQTLYVYAETATVPNCTDENSFVVTINTTPVADAPANVTACDSYVLPALTVGNYYTGSGGTGTMLPVGSSITSTQTLYVYAETATVPNCTDENSFVVTINSTPNAGVDGNTTICDSSVTPIDLFSLITGEQIGGTWTQTSGTGGTFNAGAGTFTPAIGATTSTFEYVVLGAAPCLNDISVATIHIDQNPTASISYPLTQYCVSASNVNIALTGTGSYTNGTYSASPTGLSINPTTGEISPSTSLPGNYTVTYMIPVAGACASSPVTTAITITPLPTLTISGNATYCDGDTTALTLTSTVPGTTFTWNVISSNLDGTHIVSGTGNTINQLLDLDNALNIGTATYYITPYANGCAGPAQQIEITVNPIPDVVAVATNTEICSGDTAHVDMTSAISGVTYTWTVVSTGVNGASNGTGSSIDQVLTTSNPLVNGNVVYTITPSLNGCTGASVTVQIDVKARPEFFGTISNPVICSGETTNINLSASLPGTNFTWTVITTNVSGASDGTGASIDQTLTSILGGTAVYTVVPELNGCSGSPIQVTVIVNPLPVAEH